jgi:hypothetical protein
MMMKKKKKMETVRSRTRARLTGISCVHPSRRFGFLFLSGASFREKLSDFAFSRNGRELP